MMSVTQIEIARHLAEDWHLSLLELEEELQLSRTPLRIECYDISNISGTSVVASMVVFEDGLAKKS